MLKIAYGNVYVQAGAYRGRHIVCAIAYTLSNQLGLQQATVTTLWALAVMKPRRAAVAWAKVYTGMPPLCKSTWQSVCSLLIVDKHAARDEPHCGLTLSAEASQAMPADLRCCVAGIEIPADLAA